MSDRENKRELAGKDTKEVKPIDVLGAVTACVYACMRARVSAPHPAPAFLRLLHMLTTIRDELWWWELYNPIPL